MHRLSRHTLNALTALSLLLCVATVAVMVRRSRGVGQAVEFVTPWHGYWQLSIVDGLVLTRVRQWPEGAGGRITTVSATTFLPPKSLTLLDLGGFNGAHASGAHRAGIGLYHGEAAAVLDGGGVVLRGPPFPGGPPTGYNWSRPMPFWKVDVDYGVTVAGLMLLPVGRVAVWAARRVRTARRLRDGRCPPLRLRPPRDAGPMPGVRHGEGGGMSLLRRIAAGGAGVVAVVAIHPGLHITRYPRFHYDLNVLGYTFHAVPSGVALGVPLLALVIACLLVMEPSRRAKMRDAEAQRRRKSGRCAQCGYPLTGNVSGVCPECGTTVG